LRFYEELYYALRYAVLDYRVSTLLEILVEPKAKPKAFVEMSFQPFLRFWTCL
jgi:hypothetical protein